MKTLFKSIFAALPAVAFWACSNPDVFEELRPSVGETVELTISTGRPEAVDTRTMVAEDGKTPLWCPEDAIGVSVLSGSSYTNHEFTNDNTESPTRITTFSGTTAVSDWLYTYYPYTAGEVTADGLILITVPAVQHPAATSFDGAADILVGKPVEMTKETTKIEGLQFKRAGGFLKIVLKDATSGQVITGESVECLSVTAENSLAGDAYLDIVNGELGEIGENGSTTVTAEYPSAAYCIGSDAEAAYLGVYPQTLSQGSTITISAKTLYYEIRREIELPVDIEINAGSITTLTVNIDEANITERVLHIDEAFPDPIFRKYVSENFDTDHDGKLSKEEILAVEYIDVSKSWSTPDEEKIASLEGIQYFTNLTDLYCNNNQLTTLDVSGCTALTDLYCENNQLTTLDVSKNTALVNLYCLNNQLTTLDVSKNTTLERLDCLSNQLTTLDVSKNTALYSLSCSSNQLTTLDVSKNTKLTTLNCGSNQLTTLDVSKNTALTSFDCSFNQLTILDVSQNTALTILGCGNNQLTTLDLSNNPALELLYCDNNQLTILDVSKTNLNGGYLFCGQMPTLTTLYLKTGWEIDGITTNRNSYCIPDHTEIVFVDEEGNIEAGDDIEKLFPDPIFRKYVSDNFDTDYDGKLSKEEILAVTRINIGNNYDDRNNDSKTIKSLEGVQYFTNLTYLNFSYNQLTDLDVSQNTALTELWCDYNRLTTLDVSKNIALELLHCDVNPLTTLDVSNNTALITLSLWTDNLSTLILSNNPALKTLMCHWNQLTTLDLSNCPALEYLDCHANLLETLDVSKNTKLRVLYCYDNQLTTLDVSKNTALTYLDCNSNQLTTLDVSKTNLNGGTLICAPMETLETLYLKTGWEIDGITTNRSTNYIPDHTNIEFVN